MFQKTKLPEARIARITVFKSFSGSGSIIHQPEWNHRRVAQAKNCSPNGQVIQLEFDGFLYQEVF